MYWKLMKKNKLISYVMQEINTKKFKNYNRIQTSR